MPRRRAARVHRVAGRRIALVRDRNARRTVLRRVAPTYSRIHRAVSIARQLDSAWRLGRAIRCYRRRLSQYRHLSSDTGVAGGPIGHFARRRDISPAARGYRDQCDTGSPARGLGRLVRAIPAPSGKARATRAALASHDLSRNLDEAGAYAVHAGGTRTGTVPRVTAW